MSTFFKESINDLIDKRNEEIYKELWKIRLRLTYEVEVLLYDRTDLESIQMKESVKDISQQIRKVYQKL